MGLRMDGRAGMQTLGVWRTPAGALLSLTALVDVLLIGFYVAQSLVGRPGGFVFDLGADRGYGEFFQYTKSLWAAVLLGTLWLQRRSGVYLGWALVCAYLLVDDAFTLHERAGWAIRDLVPGQPGWAVHAGELAFLAGVGISLLVILAATYSRASREDREISIVLAGLFAILVFFGVVLDAVHHLLFPSPALRSAFTTVEDGGEMLTLSLIVAFVFAVAMCGHQPRVRGRLRKIVEWRNASATISQ